MKNILLKYNKSEHEKVLKIYNSEINIYNSLIEVVKKNSDKIEIDPDNIFLLVKYPEMFLFDYVVSAGNLNINGFPISKEKAIGLIDFPKKFQDIIKASKEVKAKINALYSGSGFEDIDRLEVDELDAENDKLFVSENKLNEIKEEFHIYTANENQEQAFTAVSAMLENIHILKKMGLISNTQLEEYGEIFGVKFSFDKLSVDIEQIIRIK